MMGTPISRREFLAQTALLTASGLLYARPLASLERVGVAVVGLHTSGRAHLDALALAGGARVVALCDHRVDRLDAAVRHAVARRLARLETDVGRVLDDPQVEAVILAAGSSTPGLLRDACAAGKDVYVSAPFAPDARTARRLAAAAGRHQRVVQHGTAATSDPASLDALANSGAGAVGTVRGVCIRALYTGASEQDGVAALIDELHLAARLLGPAQPVVRHSLRAPLPPTPTGSASLRAVELQVGDAELLVQLHHRGSSENRLAIHVTLLGAARLEFTAQRVVTGGRAVYGTAEQARHLCNFLCCVRDGTPERLAAALEPAAAAITLRAAFATA